MSRRERPAPPRPPFRLHPQTSGYGDSRIGEIHHRLTPEQVAIKAANTGYPPPRMGVSCDLADAMYIPGVHASAFRDLAYLFGNNLVQVELALTTIVDTLALRSEQEQLSHKNGLVRIESELLREFNEYPPFALDWYHPLKFTWVRLRERVTAEFARAEAEGWFTWAVNMTFLRARPIVHGGHL